MKFKTYLICCHSKVEKHDGKEFCVPSETFYFTYCTADINKSQSALVSIVSKLSFHYFDVIYISDGIPITVYSSTSSILPF